MGDAAAPRARPVRGIYVGVGTLFFLEVACARRRRDGRYLTPVSATWHGITFLSKTVRWRYILPPAMVPDGDRSGLPRRCESGLARPMTPPLDMGREALALNARFYADRPGARDPSRSMAFRQWDERAPLRPCASGARPRRDPVGSAACKPQPLPSA